MNLVNKHGFRNRYVSIIVVCWTILLIVFGLYLRYNIHELVRRPLSNQTSFAIQEMKYDMDYVTPKQMGKLADRLEKYWLKKNVQIFVIDEVVIQKKEKEYFSNSTDFISSNVKGEDQVRVKIDPIIEHTQTHQNMEAFWKEDDFYVLATKVPKFNQTYWLIQRFPGQNFKQEQMLYWTIFTSVALILLAMAVITYRSVERFITVPIQEIDKGLQGVLKGDFSFKYLGHYYQAIDTLGQTVTQLKDSLLNQQVELTLSEQKLSLLLDHIVLGVLVLDRTGHVIMINPAACQLLGVDKHIKGRSYQSVVKSYVLASMIQNVYNGRESISEEVELFVPHSKFIDVNIVPYHHEQLDDEDMVMVLLYDISDLRRLETVRTEFVANASHELRTPVTAIKGFAETLLEGALQQPDMAERFVNIIAHESNRLELIITDILELSKIEKQSNPIIKANFDITKVVDNMAEYFHKKANKKQLTIHTHVPDKTIMYIGDEHRMEQILTNLIDNAINYSDSQGHIDIHLEEADESIILKVADTGMGIPEQDQKRIFERFYRVDKGRSRNSGGTGLGLAIVNNLVKMMDGQIDVDSQVGMGTCFTVTLPKEKEF